MKIAGGVWRGCPVLMPKSENVRPTQDRVREALFNLLMGVLPGARFLDLFAGSGAVGLEALSRGAADAHFLEADRAVFTTLKRNLDAFGVPEASARLADSLKWLGIGEGAVATPVPVRAPFNIVFADPPYRWTQENGLSAIAEALRARGLIAPGGFFVAETERRTDPEAFEGYTLVRDRTYGKTRLTLWQAEGSGAVAVERDM